MVRKSEARYAKLINTFKMACQLQVSDDVPGPAHGLAKAIEILDGIPHIHNDQIVIEFPTGTKLPLHVHSRSVLQAVIREAATMVILRELRASVTKPDDDSNHGNNFSKGSRKDMARITGEVDINATTNLLRRRARPCDEEVVMDEKGRFVSIHDVYKACRLNAQDKKTLRDIIAGSIRTPSRLWHFVPEAEGKCAHPQCQGLPIMQSTFSGAAQNTIRRGKNTQRGSTNIWST
jgi:hypothetical protein